VTGRFREPGPDDRQLAWVWFAAALTAPILAWAWLRLGLGTPGCAFHRLTGVPCPTCGTTRAVQAALAGRLLEAFAWNPLMTAAIAFFELGGLAAPFWLMAGGRLPRLGPALPRWVRYAMVAAILANWLWLILHGV